MAQVSQSVIVQTKALASDNLFSSRSSINGISLRTLGKTRSFAAKRRDVCVSAKLRKPKRQHQYPWSRNPDPNVKGGVLTHLSPFKPLTENRKPVILDFEKPLMNLEKKIIDVRNMARETGLDFTTQIMSLEKKYQQVLRRLYKNLTPIQRVSIARHPHRPTFLDHVFNITEKFVELHGDRAGYDDPAIVTGLGTIEGRSYMFIGHQKGRNTKENIKRNFGMPTPHGYRKALRMMYYADHHGFPIVTFIDTPGAFADLKSEALGQGEAIAHNLRTMFGLKVPIISIVIGEGGSGGALAIGCANKLLFLENAVFYVASPEACAAILYKSAKAAPLAAKKLKITARELTRLKIADGVIPEPLGGAHVDPSWTSQQIKKAVLASMDELTKMDTQELLQHRHKKFRKLGGFQEGLPVSPKKKVNMKKKEAPSDHDELEKEVEKLKDQVLSASTEVPRISLDEMVKKLEREVESEYSQAFEALQLQTRRIGIMTEIAKAKGSKDQLMHPAMLDQMRRFKEEVKQRLPSAPNYARLSKKLDMLKELSKLKKMSEANTKAASLKEEMDKIMKQILDQPQIQEKVEMLKAEIDRSGAVTHEDLDGDLKERLFTVKKEIETQFVNALKSMNLDVEVTKARPMLEESLSNRSEELDGEIRRGIEEIVSSSDLKKEIKMLQSEAAKAGKNPSAELLNKIQALKQQISERVEKDLSASELMRKLEEEHGQEESTKMVSSLVGSDVGV